jgi:ElaB/YqjD/DUF883 family membrane-anchored ribosome-binding protein
MSISTGINESREKITNELKNVIREAEDLLKGDVRQAESVLHNTKEKLEANLSAVRKGLGQAQDKIVQSSREAAEHTDHYVQNHAWKAVGIGALAGLVVGLLVGRR